MSIQRMMSTKLITVSPTDTVGRMHQIFSKLPIHHLLVMEGSKLTGIVSDRDVLRCLSPFVNTGAEDAKDTFTANRQAHQIMNTNPITLLATSNIRAAARTMLDHGISLVPITDDHGIVIGVLSWKDVLRFLVE